MTHICKNHRSVCHFVISKLHISGTSTLAMIVQYCNFKISYQLSVEIQYTRLFYYTVIIVIYCAMKRLVYGRIQTFKGVPLLNGMVYGTCTYYNTSNI